MRYKETIKRGISLLLVLVLAVSLIVPAAAADGGSSAEMVAAFDKTSYSAGETVTVTFMVYGADFDAAGFHVTYDQSSLKYQSVQTGSGFTMPVCKAQESALELMVESDSVQQPASSGTVIAKVTFHAVTGGAKTLTFTSGSAAYLERKNAVVYNGYQALNVTAGVAVDASADAALRQAKADAAAQLETDINGKLEAGVTVAQRELLLRCLQSGRAAIHSAATQEAVKEALDKALAQAAEIAAETTLEFPKLTALYDAENNDSTTIGNMYPSFSPDATAYFLCNSRPIINGKPRSFKGATATGVTVTFNGEAVSVAADGTFAFAVPFQALENCNTLVLTDENTGLSTTYAFYSFSYGVSGGFSNVKVYDEKGNVSGDKIQEVNLSDSVTRFSTSIDRVRVGFDGSADANQECLIDLVDGNGRVLQSFTTASGDKAVSQTFLSDVIQLKKGTNCLLLRYHGVDKSKYEDGKPVETPAYRTKALVINYIDPSDSDPTLKDTELKKVELYIKGITSDAVPTESQEIKFQWKEKTKTTPARWESTVELSPDDFNLGENLEYLSQVIHLCVDLKDGQEITVTGGNETSQPRTLLPDGSYHVADYYESFGSANKPTVMKKDSFTVTINVTAKNGIDKAIYLITVNKSGKAALIVPVSERSRELTITDKNPIRTQQLTFNGVSITDAEGLPINTARALEDETLKIEFLNPEVASWDGKTRNGDNLTVSLLAQGKTDIKLTYDDGDFHLEGTAVLYVNYTVGMLAVASGDAYDLWREAENGVRKYEDGAADALLKAYQDANKVYDKYENKDRRLMNQTQFDEINDAMNDLRAAIDAFKRKEIGIKIVEFPGWPEDYDLPESVSYNEKPSNFTPKTLIGKDVDGKEYEIKVTWSCKPTWDSTEWAAKYYTFTAVLQPGYVPAENVDFPTFDVLKDQRPLGVKLSKNQVKFPSACRASGKATTATLYIYKGTTLEEIYNPDNPNGKPGAPGLGLETSVRGEYTTWLPTEWLKVPDNFSSENVGDTFEFQLTLKPGKGDDWVEYDWSNDVPENQKIYTMIVQIVDPPTLTVKGLEDTEYTVEIKGTKTDTVFGELQDPVQIDTITLGPNNWSYVLSDRGEKLVPLTYEFVAPDLTDVGYSKPEYSSKGGDYFITYTEPEVKELNLSQDKLILIDNGGWYKLQVDPGNHLESVYKTIGLNWGEHQAVDIRWLENEKNVYQITGKETGREVIYAKYEEVTSNYCTIIVLPETLTDVSSIQAGSEKQLTFPYSDDVKERTTWSFTDESIATVDKNGVVTAIKAGETTITATVQTDNLNSPRTATITYTITVTPADPGGGGGGGGTDDGSGNGGGGTLSGQATSGGGDYRDLLTDPLPQQGSNGTNKPNANTAQGARRPQAGTSQTTGQKSETTTDADGNGGDDAGSGTTGRVISVSKGDKSPGSAKELAVILISCSVLLAAGIFRGKKRGED
ncbi:MAG: hypothetical protein BHV93_07935 [Clostridiales bacterium 52_15]|nr:MAG: hypothetical protein BHV93_07935 [Clostridiales bacterium 52_15]